MKTPCPVAFGRAALALLLLGMSASSAFAQTFPAQYANALRKAEYTILSGDVNGDSQPDFLLTPKRRIVLIEFDVAIPIVAKPPSPRFALLSSGTSYSLVVNPGASIVNSSVWQASGYLVSFGDTVGTGSVAMLLQATTAGRTSFLISTNPNGGAPQLLQSLGVTALGLDLGTADTLVTLQDTNWDGRADLVVWRSGKVSSVFLAAADGTFTPPEENSGGGALTAWRAFCAALTLGDTSSAQSLLSTAAQSQYAPALAALGGTPGVTNITQNWSAPTALRNRPEYAFFAVNQVENGQTILHVVMLVFENNRWVVQSF
jgi:hypothetical protein